jgi:hypothetical protein
LLAEERRLRAASSIQSLESEVHATTKLEANAIKELRGEAQAEAREAKQAKMTLLELQQASRHDSEAIESLRSLEIERQRYNVVTANQMQAGTRQALEELLYYVEHREKGNIKDGSLLAGEAVAFNSISDTDALHKIQEHLRVHNRAAAKSEAVAAAEVEAEALAALAAKKMNEALKEELASQSRAQRDLHNELQALSSAAAAVRAVAKAKDQTITELQAAHRKMASDIAMQKVSGERLSVGSPSKGVHKVGEKIDSRDLGASRYPESASNLSRPRPEKTSSELAFDTMSLDSAATQPMNNSIAASIAKGQDSMSDCSRATVPTWDQLPSRSLPPVAGSPASKNDMTSPSKELSEEAVATALQGSPGEAESSLYQASAFLNAAAARAAAAASAVEAFIPLMQQPAANVAATAMENGASNDAPIRTLSSQTPLASMVGSSPAASLVNQASVSAILNLNSAVAPAASPGTPPDSVTGASHPPSDVSQSASQPSWEEAQAAMTDQIRKDITLLRKAISDSGMTGTALEDEVQSLLNSTFGQAALQDPSLRKRSSYALGGSAFAPRAGSPTQSRGPLLAAKETSALLPPGGRGHLGKFANPATSLEPSRQISKAMQQLQEQQMQRSRSESRPKNFPNEGQNLNSRTSAQPTLSAVPAAQGATGVVDGSSRAPLGNPQRLSALGSSGSQHSLNRRRSPDGHEVGPLADSSKAGSIVRSSSTQQLQAAQQVAAAALANAKAAQQHAISRSPQPEMRHVRSPPSVNATSSQARTDGLSRSQNAAWRDLVSRTRIGSPSPMPASSHPNGSNIAVRGQSACRQDQS